MASDDCLLALYSRCLVLLSVELTQPRGAEVVSDPPVPPDPSNPPSRFRNWRRYATVVVALGVLIAIGYYVFPTKRNNTSPNWSSERLNAVAELAQSEGANAWDDHYSVALWFANCLGVSVVTALPKDIMEEIQPFGEEWSGSGET